MIPTMHRGRTKRFPTRLLILLLLVCAAALASLRWQPRVMLWWGSERFVVGLTEGRWQFLYPEHEDYAYVSRPSVTAWIHTEGSELQEDDQPKIPHTGRLYPTLDSYPHEETLAESEHRWIEPPLSARWWVNAEIPLIGFWGFVLSWEYLAGGSVGVGVHPQFHVSIAWFWIAAPLAVWMIRTWWRRRVAPGHCANCGYDLRASPVRCPECGTAVKEIPAPRRDFRQKLRRAWRRTDLRLRRNVVWLAVAIGLFTYWRHNEQRPAKEFFRPITDLQLAGAAITRGDKRGVVEYLVYYDLSDLYGNAAGSPTPERDAQQLDKRLHRVMDLRNRSNQPLLLQRPFAVVVGSQRRQERFVRELNELRSESP